MMTCRSIKVKFPVELVHLSDGDLVILVGVEGRHEDIDLAVRHSLVAVAAFDDLLQVLTSDVPLLLGVELLEQFLHPLAEIGLGDHGFVGVGALFGGTVSGHNFWVGVTICALGGGLVESGLIAAHFCLLS